MKLLDKAVDNVVKSSSTVKALQEQVDDLQEQLKHVAANLAIVVHNQSIHHQMIMQMWQATQVILRRINENAMDMSMPEIKEDVPRPDPPGSNKPN